MSIDDGHKHLAKQLLEAQAQLAQARQQVEWAAGVFARNGWTSEAAYLRDVLASGNAPPPASNNGPRCPKCGGIDATHPRLGIRHVCPETPPASEEP